MCADRLEGGGDAVDREPPAVIAVVGAEFEVFIKEVKRVADEPVCSSFSPSVEDVDFFLRHASEIDGWRLEKEYPWYGCWADGTIEASAGRFEWQMTPAGTGFLRAGEEIHYLVCDEDFRELFPEGGSMFEDEESSGNIASVSASGDVWFEVWADVATSPPYLVILRPTDEGLEVIDPKRGDAVIFKCSDYEEAKSWLVSGYRLVKGRM